MATTLNIAANTVLKTSPGKVLTITGASAGVITGTINDSPTAGGTAVIAQLPTPGGTSLTLNWPTFAGITVNITAGAVSVQWE